jgi:hypothetical protein
MDSVKIMNLEINSLREQAHEKLKRFNAIYGKESFLGSFSFMKRFRKYRVLDRWITLTTTLENLQHGGVGLKNYGMAPHNTYNVFNNNVNDKLVQRFIDNAFPDCHESTRKYIMHGYDLDKKWEEELINYLKNDKVRELNDELIFILFSTKMPVNDFLELSELPTSYLAKLLPKKVNNDG